MEKEVKNHNPHNLQVGDRCILDEGSQNSIIVVITWFTMYKMFASIIEEARPNSEWEVMTNRLTPKP